MSPTRSARPPAHTPARLIARPSAPSPAGQPARRPVRPPPNPTPRRLSARPPAQRRKLAPAKLQVLRRTPAPTGTRALPRLCSGRALGRGDCGPAAWRPRMWALRLPPPAIIARFLRGRLARQGARLCIKKKKCVDRCAAVLARLGMGKRTTATIHGNDPRCKIGQGSDAGSSWGRLGVDLGSPQSVGRVAAGPSSARQCRKRPVGRGYMREKAVEEVMRQKAVQSIVAIQRFSA